MKKAYYFEHRISIRPNAFILYDVCLNPDSRDKSRPPAIRSVTGLSDKARRRMRKRIAWLVYLAEWHDFEIQNRNGKKIYGLMKLNFVTLTLSSKQRHTDEIIKQKILQPFLRILRNRYNVKYYFWKAEVQDNDNIHFHVTFSKFIHWRELRDIWNTLQDNLGYVTAYTEQTGKVDPNSTDIHSVLDMVDFESYMVDYMCKKDKFKKDGSLKRVVTGRIWDCSKDLKHIKIDVNCDVIGDELYNIKEEDRFIISRFNTYVKMKNSADFPNINAKLVEMKNRGKVD